ncbi:MAG: FlgD immunoglobulin-like domain containing protein [Candidatus Cloacimonadota bacterium]|nr:FlgD immunoglobulin-like domain containing protein [Candidatus Cloacimonadota bacterium]
MKKMIFFIIVITISQLFAQNFYNDPESIVYYDNDDCYFVSNHSSGKIIKVEASGNESIFNEELFSTRGLTILNNKLYIASNSGLSIINLDTALLDTVIPIEGESLLNGICTDKQRYIYVSDTHTNKIHKFDTETQEVETIATISSPNGLLYEEENNRILIVNWEGIGSIYSLDLSTNEITEVIMTGYTQLDGIDKDASGNYYVSSWNVDTVIKYNSDFEQVEQFTENMAGPADIHINRIDNELAIPNYNSNSIMIIPLNTSNDDENPIINDNWVNLKQNFPNPFNLKNSRNPQTSIMFNLQNNSVVDLEIYNTKGQLIKNLISATYLEKGVHSVNWNGRNNNSNQVSSGIYLYKITNQNGFSSSKKCIIVK